jgi:hypothetical protein
MSLSVTSTNQTTPATTTGGPTSTGHGNAAAFASSLTTAVASVQQQVTQAQAQWQQQATPFNVSGLGNTVSGLTTLLAQFSQALQQLPGGRASAGAPAAETKRVSPQAAVATNTGAVAAGAVANSGPATPSQPAASQPAASQASNTELWVRAALNQAVAQSKANGYNPETSHAVNTLRGYFSDDAQARGNAIRSISPTLLGAGGAYETNDSGVHAIAGGAPQGLDTSTPTFKTTWNKNWNRPSLHDMVNSTLGWSGAANAVNFADPANRDAGLNRKLSDAEIRTFQAGGVPADLQALIDQYRGRTTAAPG